MKLPNDLVFVHHGPVAVRTMGRDFTGVLHSELQSAVAAEIQPVYLDAVNKAQPTYIRYVSQISTQHFSFEQIVVPLASDESREPKLLLVRVAPLDDKVEILKAIFDHSPIGMIAAVQAPGDNHKMQDGKILMINAYARRLLKLPEALDCVNTVRDLGPWFRDGAMWTRTNIFNQDGQTHVHFRDRATEMSYRVTFMPLDRFVLISIIEIPV